MTGFQSTDEFNELLEGRALRFILTGTESKSGRPLSAVLQDVETGEVISVMAVSGALHAGVVPFSDSDTADAASKLVTIEETGESIPEE